MDVNQKCGLFPFDMPWRYHICIAKCLYSYRDYLPENLDKTTATIGTLSIDDERDDNNKLCRERTGSRMSFMVGKFESSDYDLASFWPVNLFALPKAGKHKKQSFIATRWCLFTNTYINQFSGVFSTKIQGQIRWKSNTQLRWNFFQESGFGGGGGVIIRVNLLKFTARRHPAGFHVLDSMWVMSRACAVAFKLPWPLREVVVVVPFVINA